MANSTPHPEVKQAYKLFKAGKRQAAGKLLRSYLTNHQDDADAWWLLSHVVTAPEIAQKALQTVLKLDPAHEKARAKLVQLGGEPPPPPSAPFTTGSGPAEDIATALEEPLPWQQPETDSAQAAQPEQAPPQTPAQPAQPVQPPPPRPSSNPFTVPVDDESAWEPPEDASLAIPESLDESSSLDEEPDDSMFFDITGDAPKPTTGGRSKVLQPLSASAPPGSRSDDIGTGAGAIAAGGALTAGRDTDGGDDGLDAGFDDSFTDDFDDSFPMPAAGGSQFEQFAATLTVEYDPFSGEPVRNPFKEIPLSDDPFETSGTDNVVPGRKRAAGQATEPTGERTGADQLLTVGVVGFSVLVMVTFVLFALNEGGRIELGIFSGSANTETLEGDNFELEYPDHYHQRCRREALGYLVCGIASQPFYNEVDLFVDQDFTISPGVMSPGLSVIVMDVPEASGSYYNGSWAKTLYNRAQQGDHFDPDAVVTYNGREDITVDGYAAFYYKYTSEGIWNEAAWDLYIPHDGIVFWMRATFFGNQVDRIPQHVIDDMIDSIDINP